MTPIEAYILINQAQILNALAVLMIGKSEELSNSLYAQAEETKNKVKKEVDKDKSIV